MVKAIIKHPGSFAASIATGAVIIGFWIGLFGHVCPA